MATSDEVEAEPGFEVTRFIPVPKSVSAEAQAFLGMGDPYLLPSIAVVVVGGALITGGRGHYLGVFGGALLLTALGTLLAGTTVPPAVRDIINGLVVLAAVITLRDKKA